MTEKFFDQVYQLGNPEETRSFYDRWSSQYDSDVKEEGYATPERAARLLAAQMSNLTIPILDFGCGTGISGVALNRAGFSVIDGIDPSAEMLAGAGKKRVYRQLKQIKPGAPVPGGYSAIAAIGVIGCGGAPVSVFDQIMDALEVGGLFAFSYNDHALAEPEYLDKLLSYTETGRARRLAEEYGPHLPRIGLNSKIYVIEKT